MIRVMELLSYEKKLRVGLFCQEKRFWDDPIAPFHYLKGPYMKDML